MNSGGPDAFGYRWQDSDEADGPEFIWNDISTTGTLLETVSSRDDYYQDQNLSFPFYFYGHQYNSIYVGSNGYITFGAGSSTYSNYPLPSSSAPSNLVAGFYDDLNPGAQGDIYFQDFGDKAIIQYNNVVHYNSTDGTYYTFRLCFKGMARYSIIIKSSPEYLPVSLSESRMEVAMTG